ncbi:LuxR C-terminal-related transcriptional regulator [Prauserella oleivorans]|uniref:LuxR C-terminal-related transcriptional regulator n=1 Tax=Prauserella oleivorans TaxID=1478153 RepID=A0ABW5W9Y5_9PSEU
MITLGIIDDTGRGAAEPFFAWLHAMDTGRFNIAVSDVSPTVRHAAKKIPHGRPDVWLLRARALGGGALQELCGEPARLDLLRPVVVVCDDDISQISAMLTQRVSAVVLVNDSPWHITSAIHAAAARKLFLSSQVLDRYRDQIVDLITSPSARRLDVLTRREHDVLVYLAEGRTNSEIAKRLFISRATVGSHVLSILRKLEVSNRTEAAALAYQLGLMDNRAPAPTPPSQSRATARPVDRKELRHA